MPALWLALVLGGRSGSAERVNVGRGASGCASTGGVRWPCYRIITDPACQPLDVGRATSVVPAGLRRAVMIRDRHCQYPGCDVPALWCDCDHRQHWSRGGATSVHNLIMLCGYHHTRLHLSGQAIIRHVDGRIEAIPGPDHHPTGKTERGP